MTAARTSALLLLATIAILVMACRASASSPDPSSSPPPSPVGGPVVTAADAVARVVAHEPRFTGIGPRDADLIGQAAWYEVSPASGVGAFIVTVRIGWGDCPSGCLEEHTWTYAVLPDGGVRLQSEGGGTVPPDAWPAPGGAGDVETGIHITAVAGPTCPVETVPPDPACAPRPVPNAMITIVAADGAMDEQIALDAAGQAFVALEPGAYTLNPLGVEGFMNGPEAQRVVVEDGKVTEVVFAYDTGIR